MPRKGQASTKKKGPVGDLSDPLGFAVMKEAYLEWMREKNYSPATVRSRDAYLRYFLQWCEERSLIRPNEITKPILERYQRFLYTYRKEKTGEPLTIRSQHARTVPVRAFFKWLTQLVRDYVKASEIGKGGACHLFRHTCATLMHENGADIRFIQQLLGHAELTTTQIYTQMAIRKLKEIHTATHPAKLENTTLDELKAELDDDDS